MKIFITLFFLATLMRAFAAESAVRLHENFDLGWRFIQADVTNASEVSFNDADWKKLDLPHDWSIAGPYSPTNPTTMRGGFVPAGIGWYRRHFTVPESLRGKKISVAFDGVYRESSVWLNGHFLGYYPYGYLGFDYDLTPFLNFGGEPNIIAVRVDNARQPNSRWYSGSGIFRHAWINATSPLHVARDGTYVTTEKISPNFATVRVRTKILNEERFSCAATLVSEVLSPDGDMVASAESLQKFSANAEVEIDQTIQLTNPQLWSLNSPNLYRVRSVVKQGTEILDDYATSFGVREIRYDVDGGFFLNGEHVKLQGVCLHHDGGCVGAAVPEGVWERRLKLLKQMGCNAVRTSHNPPAPEFLDLCDQFGVLVMDEAFDEWKAGKVGKGYALFFEDWSQRDLKTFLHRDRNHPSVVMWSVGNENYEQSVTNGAAVLRPLVETCHVEDPTRPVTAACDRIFADDGNARLDFLNLLDIVGYNYVDRWHSRRETAYGDDRQSFPQRKFVGTESECIGGVRGEYAFAPLGADKSVRAVYAANMIRQEQLWKFVATHDYVIGDFMWTGIDYLGESHGWPRKQNIYGALDTCGFPKDCYFFYQSVWATKPTLHIFPHWNWPGHEGQIIPVLAYTSCDSVELFLNGKSFGVKAREFPRQGTSGGWNKYASPQISPTTADLHLQWDVPYGAGELKAVGYKAGKKICEEVIRTAGAPAKIILSCEENYLHAGARDVASIAVKITDADGNLVPGADNLVRFEVTGAGKLIGVDNGDPASHDSHLANERKAFNGQCLALVQSGSATGELTLRASAENLAGTAVTIKILLSAEANPPMIYSVGN